MKFLNYHYVYFDDGSIKNGHINKDDYFYICTEELRDSVDVTVVSYPLDYSNQLFHKLYVLHNHPKINKKIEIPLKRLWYPFYFKRSAINTDKPMCFIMSGYYITPDYIRYLKKKFPGCKCVLIHRDLISLWHKRNPKFTRKTVEELFDLELTIDKDDAETYGIYHFDEIESKPEVSLSPEYPLSDVFFAGAAKDRLPTLIKIYDKLSACGLNCKFYITGADTPIARTGIQYAKNNMSYRQMLYYTVNSRCILEINQGGAVGYTSRFLEAVMFNKLLITNNMSIKESEFYHPQYIQCIANSDEIDPEFVKQDITVDYHYNGEFSPKRLILQIEELLNHER